MLASTFDRLSVRLALGITVLVLCSLAIVLYIISSHQYEHTIGSRRLEADRQNRILEATLRHQMMERDTTLIKAIFKDIGSQPEVQSAMILDHEGFVRFSSDEARVGELIPRDSPTCLVCHAKEAKERDRWVLLQGPGGGALRSVLPIRNRDECHACHEPARALNGILILDMSLADVQAQLQQDVRWMSISTAALALVVLLGMGVLVRQLVFVPLGRLRRAARSIATGNLSERVHIAGNDMISSVAQDFNTMADSVSRLVAEIRDQEAQLTSVMNGLDDGLVVLDHELRVVAANRSFCRRLGAHPETLRQIPCHTAGGKTLPCCGHEADCPARACLATGAVQRGIFHASAEGGETGVVEEVYASPVYDDEGRVVRVVELWRDISERVREEERLAEIERLVSLGILASGFSHEINTPLASVLTCAESALGQLDGIQEGNPAENVLPAIRDCAETIRSEVLRCRRITGRFLRFSRGIPPSIEPIDLRQVVERVVTLVAPTAREARARIVVEGDNALPAVRANTEVAQHVVLNLLVNAIQSFDGPERTVHIRFRPGDDVRIEIEDTGCGIAPEARRDLFEPFRSRKPLGTGLGLFLSRSIMRRFGGDVRLVRSEVGEGSCFEVIFRIAEDKS